MFHKRFPLKSIKLPNLWDYNRLWEESKGNLLRILAHLEQNKGLSCVQVEIYDLIHSLDASLIVNKKFHSNWWCKISLKKLHANFNPFQNVFNRRISLWEAIIKDYACRKIFCNNRWEIFWCCHAYGFNNKISSLAKKGGWIRRIFNQICLFKCECNSKHVFVISWDINEKKVKGFLLAKMHYIPDVLSICIKSVSMSCEF